MVARLDFDSVSLAQKPKSAVGIVSNGKVRGENERTDFDISYTIQQDIVTLDISMDNVLTMQVSKTFARLE